MIGGEIARLFVTIGAKTDEFNKSMDTVQSKLKKTGDTLMAGGAAATKMFTVPIVAAGAAVSKTYMDFDHAMTGSLAIMGDVSGDMKKVMADTAKDISNSTIFASKDVAGAYYFMASAGYDALTSVELMPGVAAFAQAGMFDLARATDLLTDSQSALGLSTGDVMQDLINQTRISDVLVGANTLANASVEQFAEALVTDAGPAARLLNKDIEETVAVLAVMADQGTKGQVAGSKLAIAWREMQTAALNNQEAFKKWNIEMYDSEGNMRNTADIVEDLEGALMGLSDEHQKLALMELGFTDRSVKVVQALLGTSDQIREYEDGLRNMGGVTDEVANKQLESLLNQLTLVKNNFTNMLIGIGEGLDNSGAFTLLVEKLQGAVEWLQKLADWFSNLSPKTQLIIVGILGLVAVLGPLLMMLGFVMTGISALIPVFTLLLGPVGLVIAILAGLVIAGIAVYKNWDKIKEFAVKTWTSIKDFFANIWNEIKSIFTGAGRDSESWLIRHYTKMFDFIKNIWGSIRDFFANTWTGILNFAKGIWDRFITAIKEWFNVIKGIFTGDMQLVLESLSHLWRSIFGDKIGDVLDKFLFKIVEIWDKVKAVFSNALDSIWGFIKKAFWAYVDFIINFSPNVTNAVKSIWEKVNEYMKGLPAKMVQMGKDLIQGLINGIKNMAGAAFDAVKGVVGGLITTAKNALQSKSPSQVFLALGHTIPQGLAKGIYEMAGVAKTAIGKTWADLSNEQKNHIEKTAMIAESLMMKGMGKTWKTLSAEEKRLVEAKGREIEQTMINQIIEREARLEATLMTLRKKTHDNLYAQEMAHVQAITQLQSGDASRAFIEAGHSIPAALRDAVYDMAGMTQPSTKVPTSGREYTYTTVDHTTVVELDGRVIARVTAPYMVDDIRLKQGLK
jgi:TP901 family phage tail tape measure protein